MPRTAIATPDQIRATILAMLAEAHDAAPATRERFRRIVSVRKLKDRLGGGDPATLGRAINAVESEIVAAGLADIALPDIPAEIAEQMRQLWHAAVSVQLDDVVKLKAEARQSIEKPPAHEVLPLIHGFKGGSLQEGGLYAEVKAIFEAVAAGLQAGDPARAVLLRAASPHWLRHAYAKALVVDHQVPLPVAQALLGHASVRTTAGYAKTDLSQLRVFVEGSFTSGEK